MKKNSLRNVSLDSINNFNGIQSNVRTIMSTFESYGWAIAFVVLAALSIPWFLWGSSTVAFGLPVWLWWHVGWMAVVALAFRTFARRAWGVGVEGGRSATEGGRA